MNTTLQAQIEKLQNELREIEAKDVKSAADLERRSQINWDLMKLEPELQSQLDAQKEQLAAKHEERVQTAKDEFATYIQASLEEEGLTLGEIFSGETAQQLYTIKCSQAFNALVRKLSEQVSGAEEREIQLKRQNDDLQDKVEAIQAELRQAQTRAAQFEFERDEAIKNRDNAAKALEEAKQEVERLTSQVDDLRKEIAVGARNAIKVIDDEEHKRQVDELVKKIKESRIKVVNMRPAPDDFKRQTWLADDALTGETYTFNYLDKGKYMELAPDEVLQFRAQHAQEVADANQPLVPVTAPALPPIQNVTEQQFPGGGNGVGTAAEGSEDGAGEENEPGSVDDDAPVSRSEYKALEARVSALESQRAQVA